MSSSNNLKFWLKHLSLAVILIVLTILVLNFVDFSAITTSSGSSESRDPAKNMSRVYAQHRMSSISPIKEDKGDFVLDVNVSDEDLNERLVQMESLQKPVSGRWVGENKMRTFKAGSTLRESITDFAQREGMQVIWELDQDFIIKNHFQMENSIVGSLRKIGSAVDANFGGIVETYFCPKQRTLVVTDKQSEYLQNNCARAKD